MKVLKRRLKLSLMYQMVSRQPNGLVTFICTTFNQLLVLNRTPSVLSTYNPPTSPQNFYVTLPPSRPLYLLDYIPTHNRVYLTDKDLHIYGYALSLSVVKYQTAILRGDTEAAAEILPTLPKDQLDKVARFLEARDLKELALQITTDPDHKFDLAVSLDDLGTALQITHTIPENESEIKWKALGDRALTVWRFDLARECFEKAGDLSALMLLLVSVGDRDGLKVLAGKPEEKGQNNLAFAILLQLGDSAACVDLSMKIQRAPEAALFVRTYSPSQAPKAVQAWKSELTSKNRTKIAATIADPSSNPELFEEGWEEVLAREGTLSVLLFRSM